MENFWDRVEKCKHERESDYYETGNCDTPYCGWSETHCLDCGVYIMKCNCGFCNGMGGWPHSRRRAWERRKERENNYTNH